MLPAIVGLLVALAVLLMLLAALRTSKGRKLLSKLRERAKKQKDDGPMTTGANVRENDTQLGMPSSEELADLDLSTSFFDSLMVKLRILISMIQVLSQLGVVYAIPFPSLYSNLLRWVGLLELNFIDILPLGCVMSVGFHFSLLMRTLVLPALLLAALAAKVVRALEPERAQWHDPVLGRWLGLTPEQPALCLRGFPGRPRAALSRVSDPPGLGRRQGAQRAASGTIREKRYNLPDPGVHHTNCRH